MNYQEFVEFMKRPGAKSTIRYDWMIKGCPKCGSKKWQVTMDAWAYCEGCGASFPTEYALTNMPVDYLDFS